MNECGEHSLGEVVRLAPDDIAGWVGSSPVRGGRHVGPAKALITEMPNAFSSCS